MGSHSVTCHPTQVSTPRLNPSNTITSIIIQVITTDQWEHEHRACAVQAPAIQKYSTNNQCNNGNNNHSDLVEISQWKFPKVSQFTTAVAMIITAARH